MNTPEMVPIKPVIAANTSAFHEPNTRYAISKAARTKKKKGKETAYLYTY